MQYNKATQIIPYNDVIPNRRNTSKVVKVAIRFNDFNGADPIAGIVNLGVDIGMSWKDDYTSVIQHHYYYAFLLYILTVVSPSGT
jgi:hypothetical protein